MVVLSFRCPCPGKDARATGLDPRMDLDPRLAAVDFVLPVCSGPVVPRGTYPAPVQEGTGIVPAATTCA